MSAPQIAPFDLGSIPSSLGPGESEPYPPRLASVTEISPPKAAETDEEPVPDVEQDEPDPTPSTPEASPAPAEPPARPEPEELTEPPKPEVETAFQAWLSNAFEGIFWFSVAVGLVGQIIGFAKKFGGTPVGIGAAILVGGIFEFLMITGSSRGFSAIRTGRAWHEFLPYLAVATGAAGVASGMALTHWAGDMALYFGGLTIFGYVSHLFSHIHPSLRARRDMQAWAAEKQRVESERQRREAEQREAYEAWLRDQQERVEAEAERQRQEAEQAERRAALREQNADLINEAERLLRKRPKRGTKATAREARAIGVYREVRGTAELRDSLAAAGYVLPGKDTVKSWWTKDVRPRLEAAGSA